MIKVTLPASDAGLLAQCTLQTFRASGKGGQHVNTTDSAVRLIHRPSGLRVSSQQERSQHLNKRLCLQRLRAKLRALNYRPPPRIKTTLPRAVRKKILAAKTRQGNKKRLRAKPAADD